MICIGNGTGGLATASCRQSTGAVGLSIVNGSSRLVQAYSRVGQTFCENLWLFRVYIHLPGRGQI